MNEAQTLFTVFYGVMFAAMLSSLAGLQAFPWGYPSEDRAARRRLGRRLLVSLLLFNLLPVGMFAFGHTVLSGQLSPLSVIDIGAIAIAGLAPFAAYRLFTVVLVALGSESPVSLYSKKEFDDILEKRNIRASVRGHMIAVAVYGGFFGCLWLL